MEIDFQPEIVGREEELTQLQRYLDDALQGQGSTILISGEAGIGKTRLLEASKKIAQSKGFRVLGGNSLYESLTPYMPFLEALKSGGLESLFAEEAPKVEAAYLVTHTGLLIKEVLREETELDPDIFTSMLTTVGNFVKDSLLLLSGEEREGALNTMGYENYRILIESGRTANLVVTLKGRENEFLINDMREILRSVGRRYGDVLKDWDGNEERIRGIENLLQPLIGSGKYDGIYYGFEYPKARRNLLFENVSMGLTRQAETTPTLLCIEDLQWADPSSLALMHYVARNTKRCSLLVLGTYRPEDVLTAEGRIHPLTETMQLMNKEDLYKKMEIRRLPKEYMPEFLSSLLGSVDFADETHERLYKETEGNPLFIVQLVKLMVDEEIVRPYDGTWRLATELEEVDIPSKVYHVIVRRLDRLDKEERRTLDYASVIGDTFTSDTLTDALAVERISLLERLRALEQNHILIRSQNGSYAFDHSKIKEVLYDEIPTELRMEYHQMVANSIEFRCKDDLEEVVGDLAFHYCHCRSKDKALLFLMKAAKKAKKEYSNKEANRFYTEALEFEDDRRKRSEMFEALGDIYDLIGEYDKSIESYNRALELADEIGRRVGIQTKIGGVYESKGEYDESMRIYDEALGQVKDQGSEEEGTVLNAIGTIHWNRGEYDKATEFGKRSLDIFEDIGFQLGVARSLIRIANVKLIRGEFERALEHYRRAHQIRVGMGDQASAVRTLSNIGAVYQHIGEYDKSFEHFNECLKMMEKIGDQAGIAYSLNNVGVVHEAREEYESALECYQRSLEIVKRIGDQQVTSTLLHNIGLIYGRLEKYDKALEHFERSLEMSSKIEHQPGRAQNYVAIAVAHLKKGTLEEAKEFASKGLELSKEMDLKKNIADSMKTLGMIYREQEKWEESIKNFEECITCFGDSGDEKGLADSEYEFGLMWKKKGDTARAEEHLNKALDIYTGIKLDRMVERVTDALRDLKTQKSA